jgi:hypothetical protein
MKSSSWVLWMVCAGACTGRQAGPIFTIADLRVHDQPVVLSSRVAIDENPCESAAYVSTGVLQGELTIPGERRQTLEGTIVGQTQARDLEHAAVRSGVLDLAMAGRPFRERVDVETTLQENSHCRPTIFDDRHAELSADPRCYHIYQESEYRTFETVAGEAVHGVPDVVSHRCTESSRP